MAALWVLKTEPSSYGFDDLVREGRAVWDGVTNPVALRNLRAMRKGDRVLIYHTGEEKRLVGFAEVAGAAYPDPKRKDERLVVVDVTPGRRLPRPVALAAIRAEPALKDLALVRQPRLSVVPVNPEQWKRLLQLAGA